MNVYQCQKCGLSHVANAPLKECLVCKKAEQVKAKLRETIMED